MRVWGPAAIWAVVLFLLSAWPSPSVPTWLRGSDKLAHAGLYCVLGMALAYGRRRGDDPPPHWLMLLVGALYGASDEWHQVFVRGRSPDMGDWLADLAGVIVGYVLVLGLTKKRNSAGATSEGVDAAQ